MFYFISTICRLCNDRKYNSGGCEGTRSPEGSYYVNCRCNTDLCNNYDVTDPQMYFFTPGTASLLAINKLLLSLLTLAAFLPYF